MECLKILKKMNKSRRPDEPYNKELLRNLFFLYQQFIFLGNEEVQWAVSTYIKDHLLDEEHINWLIDNYLESEHIVNRLLRYPVKNGQVTDWAHDVLMSGKLRSRISEIVGFLIDEKVPDFVKEDNTTIMWAIYYSKCSKAKKRKLLLKHLDYENYLMALEVANRLDIGEVSYELLKHYRGLSLSNVDVV
ncbi:hypothetical protein [Paenibacillus macerans]|uniref:hypothetical protein n=1 Tax=Paenibacillus macerans TaxID=44252 RepID=UPI003D322D70